MKNSGKQKPEESTNSTNFSSRPSIAPVSQYTASTPTI